MIVFDNQNNIYCLKKSIAELQQDNVFFDKYHCECDGFGIVTSIFTNSSKKTELSTTLIASPTGYVISDRDNWCVMPLFDTSSKSIGALVVNSIEDFTKYLTLINMVIVGNYGKLTTYDSIKKNFFVRVEKLFDVDQLFRAYIVRNIVDNSADVVSCFYDKWQSEIDKDKNVFITFNFAPLNTINENIDEFIEIEEILNKDNSIELNAI